MIWLIAQVSMLAGGELITAGPMIGHTTESSVSIWYQAKEGATHSLSLSSLPGMLSEAVIDSQEIGRGCRLVRINGLKSDVEREFEIRLQEAELVEAVTLRVKPLPSPSETGAIRIAFGSCAKITQYPAAPIYRAMAAEQPDLALFVGDNSYFIVNDGSDKAFSTSGPVGDWTSAETMLARHLENRRSPDLQDLLRSTPCYAVWDDHDYGPNNADRGFVLKNEALDIFKSVWANPSYGTSESPGIFSSFRAGPVEVFLMDDRFYKYVANDEHPEVPVEQSSIWGEAQLEWLKAGLKTSSAPVKLIANGTQVIAETEKGEGHFQEALAERERLFDFLKEQKIGGVVFLSGDRHYSESLRLEQQNGPWILEFTSSPLCQGKPIAPLPRVKHRTQVWGLDGDSYGLVTVDIPEVGKGTIRFEARDASNYVPIINAYRTVTTTELQKLNYE